MAEQPPLTWSDGDGIPQNSAIGSAILTGLDVLVFEIHPAATVRQVFHSRVDKIAERVNPALS